MGAQVGDPRGLAQPEPQPVVLCRHGVTRWMDPPGCCTGAEQGPEEPNLYISIKKLLKPSLEGPGGLEQLLFQGSVPGAAGRDVAENQQDASSLDGHERPALRASSVLA